MAGGGGEGGVVWMFACVEGGRGCIDVGVTRLRDEIKIVITIIFAPINLLCYNHIHVCDTVYFTTHFLH